MADAVVDGCVLELKPAGGGSGRLVVVDCFLPEAADDTSIHEEEQGAGVWV